MYDTFLTEGKPQKMRSMKMGEFNKIIKQYKKDFETEEQTKELAYIKAKEAVAKHPGLKAYIQRVIGLEDYLGWFANQL